jgi:amino acid permease
MGASIAYVNTIVGGGIVTLPFVVATIGISYAIMLHLFVIALMLVTVHFCLKTKDHLGYESYSELAYLCFGRSSVFIINGLICFCISGIITLYLILVSKILLSLIPIEMMNEANFIGTVLCSREFIVIAYCMLLMPFVFKKRLAELKIASYLQVFGIVMLIVTFIFKAIQQYGVEIVDSPQ